MGKRELLYTVSGIVNGEVIMEYSVKIPQKLKIELPYNPVIPFYLGIYLKKTETIIRKHICIPKFIVALIIAVKIWKQS